MRATQGVLIVLLLAGLGLCAEPEAGTASQERSSPTAGKPVPLNPQKTVLLDLPNRRLLLETKVVLREGVLEMLICKAQTKEHESILAIESDAYLIHAGLLALGAQPGSPARFDDQFHPPSGPVIRIYVNWKDAEGRPHRERAQQWVRHVTRRYYEAPLATVPAGVDVESGDLRYDSQNKLLLWFGTMTAPQRDALLALSPDKAYQAAIRSFFERSQPREMEADWVFAGSGFYQQEDGRQFYLAESGNIVCVANFSDALLDVSVESTASDAELLFEPYTERIPPLGTPVTVELIPVTDEPAERPSR